jgi:hypothetical protein
MKKLMLCIGLVLLLGKAGAQEFKKFKTGIGFGITSPSNNSGAGPLFYLEPGYRITDALLINFRLETALILADESDFENNVGGLGSYTVNAQYYLGNNKFRPFAGLGVGFFRLATSKAELIPNGGGSVIYGYANKPGFYTRGGFDWGHMNVSIDYNFVTASTIESIDQVNANAVIVRKKSSNSYVGFRFGFSIGGGKNKT